MDLKEFITETITAIVDSTTELQEKYATEDIVINPPSAQSGTDVFQMESRHYTMRRVKNIEFDVAVSASSTTEGAGKASIQVLSIGIGGSKSKAASSEQVSRVSFSVPLTLKPSSHEERNNTLKKAHENRRISVP